MRVIPITCLILTVFAVSARAELYEINPGEEGNLVVFESKAPMESFKGKTKQVSGTIEANLSQLADSLNFRIEVDMASLDTGIGLRNQHMRDNHLETDTYPVAVFSGGLVKSTTTAALSPGTSATVRIAGEMSLHGVTRPLDVDIVLNLREDGVLNIASDFKLNLSDYDIKRPKFLVLKLADEQKIHVEFAARPAAMSAAN
jgi:polyisoprenoid-binding protein YceI